MYFKEKHLTLLQSALFESIHNVLRNMEYILQYTLSTLICKHCLIFFKEWNYTSSVHSVQLNSLIFTRGKGE